MAEGAKNQILLLAPELLGDSLVKQLTVTGEGLQVFSNKEQLTRHPCLVIWSLESIEVLTAIHVELRRLQAYWHPAPVLLILPAKLRHKTNEILQLDCPGILQDPDLKTLKVAIQTLREGGRVVRLKDKITKDELIPSPPMGLGQWLLISGIQQINNELETIQSLINRTQQISSLQKILLNGRKRELKLSKYLLFWIWGPLGRSSSYFESNTLHQKSISKSIPSTGQNLLDDFGTNISLDKRNALAVWDAINKRLKNSVEEGLVNSTGNLLALEGLNVVRQRDLLISLINQCDQVITKLRSSPKKEDNYPNLWYSLQLELRQEALRNLTGSYMRLPFQGELTPISEKLLSMTDLMAVDDELPDAENMLDPLILDKPVLVEGQLLPADDPRALIHLEMHLSNWLIRTSEIISSEVIGACGEWPELRRYLLKSELISTRELERLRNQLNSQIRWQNLVRRPIALYESKRILFRLRKRYIEPVVITEPRDEELRQLGWWQQQVALLVEARDALSPQIQSLVKKTGDLMVVILTQVVGRAIGLVGKGIAQGMGRSLSRN